MKSLLKKFCRLHLLLLPTLRRSTAVTANACVLVLFDTAIPKLASKNSDVLACIGWEVFHECQQKDAIVTHGGPERPGKANCI